MSAVLNIPMNVMANSATKKLRRMASSLVFIFAPFNLAFLFLSRYRQLKSRKTKDRFTQDPPVRQSVRTRRVYMP